MAENPLLPNAELRALLRFLRALSNSGEDRNTPFAPTRRRRLDFRQQGREALLAGTLLQLKAPDVLVLPEAGTEGLQRLLPGTTDKVRELPLLSRLSSSSGLLSTAVGIASGLKRAKREGLVLVLVEAGIAMAHWVEALTWAQAEQLPLVLACADPSGDEAFRAGRDVDADRLTWDSLRKPAARLQLPVLTVDGDDAVAVYRVMQESVLRARAGGGPAVLWAALPADGRPGVRRKPGGAVPRLESYLAVRKIPFRA